MADDNVVKFPKSEPDDSHVRTFCVPPTTDTPVLTVGPDGRKRRGGDMLSLEELPRSALLKIIDELCDVIRRRG